MTLQGSSRAQPLACRSLGMEGGPDHLFGLQRLVVPRAPVPPLSVLFCGKAPSWFMQAPMALLLARGNLFPAKRLSLVR